MLTSYFRLAAIAACLIGLATAGSWSYAGDERALPPQSQMINEQMTQVWSENKIQPSKRCTDYEFVRRVFLDLIGRIPKSDEVTAFMNSKGPNRRSDLIQKLLHDKAYNDEYARHWANLWTVWLLTRSGNPTYHEQMHLWLEEQFAKNISHKDMVASLLTATGKTNDNQAVNYILAHLGEKTPNGKTSEEGHFEVVPITSRTTRLFLGLQTQCVQCHDHPFNPEWKQSSFWGVNVFFRQVERVGNPPQRENPRMPTAPILELRDDPSVNKDGIVYFERRNGMIMPAKSTFVDGKRMESSPSKSRRQNLAELIVNHENFGKAYVNRMWGHFFGRGLNEQPAVDDFGDHNKVIHPELLDRLGMAFADYADYNPKELMSWICNSDAYQLSSICNTTNEKPDTDVFMSRMFLKSLSPEQLLESLWVATQGKSASQSGDNEAVQKRRKEWTSKLVKNFGDDEGNEVVFNGTVVQALLMMNGREINEEIRRDGGTVSQALKTKDHGKIVAALYLAALNRLPETNEPAIISRVASKSGGKMDATFYGDVMWALLNSNEFILNH